MRVVTFGFQTGGADSPDTGGTLAQKRCLSGIPLPGTELWRPQDRTERTYFHRRDDSVCGRNCFRGGNHAPVVTALRSIDGRDHDPAEFFSRGGYLTDSELVPGLDGRRTHG